MGKSTISEQAESYAKVIVDQIKDNFETLASTVKGCDDFKSAQKEYDDVSPLDENLETIDALKSRAEIIENNLGDIVCDGYDSIEPLAVGLFGEWGSGKTHQLKLIKKEIFLHNKKLNTETKETSKEDESAVSPQVIIPVFFNAWRFEKEEHIIIPLFQTLLDTVENYERTLGEKIGRSFKSTIYHLKNVLFSLHHGINYTSAYKAVRGVVTNNLEDMREAYNVPNIDGATTKAKEITNKEQGREQTLTELLKPDPLESIYLNIPQWIEKITLFEKVNFVFLIDDLDRCLPENTLKMLESIKLFLDVPSCAFVLAVDDDVVERGVVHHYRDYLSIYHSKDIEGQKSIMQHELPITGHEYLEKMIQLPLRLPVIDTENVRDFLEKHSKNTWIKLLNKIQKDEKVKRTKESQEENKNEVDLIQTSEIMLDFFKDIIPPKPRKIKRTAKLFESKLQLLKAMGLSGKVHPMLIAKITLLELFAPKILRFIQSNDYAQSYRALHDFHYIADIEKREKKNTLHDIVMIKDFIKTNEDYTQEQKDRYRKLLEIIQEHHNSRVTFNLGYIFDTREEYGNLKIAIEYREHKVALDDKTVKQNIGLTVEMEKALFVEDNSETWGATLRSYNKMLDATQLDALIAKAKTKKDKIFNNLSYLANPEWVGVVAEYVSEEDYITLLKASHNVRFKTHEMLDFEIDSFQITFAEYDKYCVLMHKDKPKDNGWGRGRRPVINVSWQDAKAYVKWLNAKELEYTYALLSEEQWKSACSLDKKKKWHFDDDESKLKEHAWYHKNSEGKTHRVGELKSNELNLYDMHGNVWEWCEDWYKKDGKNEEKYKVLKGGSWVNVADYTRSANRVRYDPTIRVDSVGFRLLRTLP